MKKTPLIAASALLSVMLLSGMAYAKSDTSGASVAGKPPVAATAPEGQGPMGQPMMAKSPLSETTQKMIREGMEKNQEANKGLMEEMKKEHEALQAIVQAPEFDRKAYLNKHEDIQEIHHKLSVKRAETMADVMEKMTPEERKAFVLNGPMMGRHHGGLGMKGPRGMMADCPMGKDGKPPKEGCPMMKGAPVPAESKAAKEPVKN